MTALRNRGYPTVDVPLGLLPSRMRYEKPSLVVLDADAHEAHRRARAITEEGNIVLVLIGNRDGALARDPIFAELGALVCFRPLDVEANAGQIVEFLGPAPRGGPRPTLFRASRAPVLVASARKPYRSDASPSSRPPPQAPEPFETDWPTTGSPSVGPMMSESLFPSPDSATKAPLRLPSERPQPLSNETRALLDQARRRVASHQPQISRPARLGLSTGEGNISREFLLALEVPLERSEEPVIEEAKHARDGDTSGGSDVRKGTDLPPPPSEELDASPRDLEVTNPGGRVDFAELDVPSERTNPGGRRGDLALSSRSSASSLRVLPSIDDLSDLLDKPLTRPQGNSVRAHQEQPIDLDSGLPPGVDTFARGSPSTRPGGRRDVSRQPEDPKAASSGFIAPESPFVALGRAVGERQSGSLAQQSAAGVRRVLLKDGDIVTVTSSSESESLVQFLEHRGDLSSDALAHLGALPRFGRHAGAALVARGQLRQEDLWPVLRAHAEWVLGQILVAEAAMQLEAEIPARLLEEPAVFGGAAGAEIYVDAVRRVMQPRAAYERLGSGERTLSLGERDSMLAECGLPGDLDREVRSALGQPLSRLLERSPGLLVILAALTELGVLSVGQGTRPTPKAQPNPARSDEIDAEAFAARVRSRRSLVEDGDYFSILGVSRSATGYEIQRAHDQLLGEFRRSQLTAKTLHLEEDLATILTAVTEAHLVLSDEVRRDRYRRALEAEPPA